MIKTNERNTCICMYLYVSVCIRMYIYVSVCIRMYPYVSVCIRMYLYVSACIRMYPYVSVCIRMYPYVSVCICMYLKMHDCLSIWRQIFQKTVNVLTGQTTVDCSPLSTGVLYSRLQRVTIPDAAIIQYGLLKTSMVRLETFRGL
jgi:hypothetical protein